MQFAHHPTSKGITRAAEWMTPPPDALIIPNREQALKHIAAFDKQLGVKLPAHERAEILVAKAMIYEAIGAQKMLPAALEAWDATKTSTTAHLVAVAHHHFGNIKEAIKFYGRAYRYPHEPGFNVDIAYVQALMFAGRWQEAHQLTLTLKKRMVYAAYLPEWDRKPFKEISLISEGGFGDLIHMSRFIPMLQAMGGEVTAYLPDYFFNHGFVDLLKRQPWFPKVKLLIETPMKTPAVGFFDLPAVFGVTQADIPGYPMPWIADSNRVAEFAKRTYLRTPAGKPVVGFCWAARQQETPLCPDGVYRALTKEQAKRIIAETEDKITWVSLQKDFDDVAAQSHIDTPAIQSWEDNAAIIENLDAVVTVDTANMHLAAAMGKPTHVLLSGAIDWKFGMAGDRCSWYPTTRLYRNNGWGFDNTVDLIIRAINQGELNG